MNHRVGIATDRACEVSIVVECQSKVSNVMHTVLRFHHSTECNRLNHLCFGLVVTVVHEFVEAASHGTFRAIGLHFIAELDDKLPQSLHLLRVRIVMYAIRERLLLLSFLYFPDAFCHSSVGQKHELLNQFVGIARAFEVTSRRFSLCINVEMQCFAVEFHSSTLETAGT